MSTATTPPRSRARAGAFVSAAAVIAAVGAFGTYAAWSDTTSNGPNTFASGNLSITDDDGGAAMFAITNMKPGTTQTKCINVTNAGSVDFANVAFSGVQSGALASSLKVTVERGSGASGGTGFGCTGFTGGTAIVNDASLSAFPSSGSPVNDGTGWTPTATKSYRVQVSLPSSSDNTSQSKNAELTMSWAATS